MADAQVLAGCGESARRPAGISIYYVRAGRPGGSAQLRECSPSGCRAAGGRGPGGQAGASQDQHDQRGGAARVPDNPRRVRTPSRTPPGRGGNRIFWYRRTPHLSSPALYHDLALDGADRATRHGRDSMIRRPVIWCPRRHLRQPLRRVLDRAVACCGTGLRCECLHAKRPEGPAPSR